MDPDTPRLLQVVPTEIEAAAIVARLDAEDIPAWVEGGIIGGFRAEAPGGTSIYVHASDHERAARALGLDSGPERAGPTTEPGAAPRRRNVLWVLIVLALAAWLVLSLLR